MAKIKLKVIETPTGLKHLCLCDGDGNMLPAQASVTIISEPDNIDRAIVEFLIGDDCPIVGEKD